MENLGSSCSSCVGADGSGGIVSIGLSGGNSSRSEKLTCLLLLPAPPSAIIGSTWNLGSCTSGSAVAADMLSIGFLFPPACGLTVALGATAWVPGLPPTPAAAAAAFLGGGVTSAPAEFIKPSARVPGPDVADLAGARPPET